MSASLITLKEFAQRLKISSPTALKWIRSEAVPKDAVFIDYEVALKNLQRRCAKEGDVK